ITDSHKRSRRDEQEPTNGHKKTRLHERDESPDPSSSSSDSILDDEFNDGEAAYQQFKNRKGIQRKRASLNARRARKGKGKERESDVTPGRRRRSVPARDSLVGRIPAESASAAARNSKWATRDYTEDLVSSEDDLMEHTLPEFLQQRRSQFDARMNRLKEAGLRLPPNFDDVEFSDDENLEFLKEKPSFRDITPSKPYEDIPLPFSLGLIPAPIAQWLRDYQVEGAAFMHELFVYQKGGILGDDMGLGKTVQVIAFLTAAYGKTADERDMK
ncbi:hypothetical protein F66182_14006, partial [Fusarium sp. NRRL 66182]